MELPKLFQSLSDRDWDRMRSFAASLDAGEEQPFLTDAGYLDVGKGLEGSWYCAANSFDANGRDFRYRKLSDFEWPRGGQAGRRAHDPKAVVVLYNGQRFLSGEASNVAEAMKRAKENGWKTVFGTARDEGARFTVQASGRLGG